jgi:alanine dehydrogenase
MKLKGNNMKKIRVGIPKEIKNHEYRVGATPGLVQLLIQAGAEVFVQKEAGTRIGYDDTQYEKSGAHIVEAASDVYQCDLIIKVKEPQPEEFGLFHKGQTLFCFLHLAPDPAQASALKEAGVQAIAFETVTDSHGRLPLLAPMSEIAGKIATHIGASTLHMAAGGRGVLLGGVAGVLPAHVVVLGGGVSGTAALRTALGLGAQVTVLDTNIERLKELDALFGPRLQTLYSTPSNCDEVYKTADLIIGAVLVPGKLAPRLITRRQLKLMPQGAVLVDISIDQGGCAETSRPTTHSNPTYVEEGVVHYCVTNMPGACARTATQALSNAISAHALRMVRMGVKEALLQDAHLLNGLNVAAGSITHEAVARDLKMEYVAPASALSK